jgi:hypothetical protein
MLEGYIEKLRARLFCRHVQSAGQFNFENLTNQVYQALIKGTRRILREQCTSKKKIADFLHGMKENNNRQHAVL